MRVRGLTVVRYQSVLKYFTICMHDAHIEDITIKQIITYLMELQRLETAPNGVQIVALALRKFFEYYNLRGLKVVDEQLIPLPQKEFNMPRVASKEQFDKMLKSIPADGHPNHIRNRALVSCLWDTGARIGEILSLDTEQLDLKRRCAVIKTEKSRGRRPIREIFWTPETNKLLKIWVEKRKHLSGLMNFEDPEALFVSITKTKTAQVRGRRLTNRSTAEIFRLLSNKAGLKSVANAHSFRHAFGRDVRKNGGNISDVADLLGHSSIDSAQFYTWIWGDDLHDRHSELMGNNRGKRRPGPSNPMTKSALGGFARR